jgi:hypothetical protein
MIMSRLNVIFASLLLTATSVMPVMASNTRLSATASNSLADGATLSTKYAAKCNQWNTDGTMIIRQLNGFKTTVNMYGEYGDAYFSGGVGKASISASGNRFFMRIRWGGGQLVGVYTAYINSDGSLTGGITYDARNPSSRATWSTNKVLVCR